MKKQSVPDEPQLRRIHKAQSRMGRLSMRLAMRFERSIWLAVVSGTQAIKRLFDILISITAMLLAAPLMALIALLIRRDGGPVLLKQRRIGFHGRDFEMLKFRSMCVDADARPGQPRAQNAPCITPIGRFIRKTSIDELPLLFNVLRGDLSIVGPRPCLPREAALYSSADRRRLHARPGITCLWQVGEREGRFWEIGVRNGITFGAPAFLDARHIENHSVLRDVWILLKTLPTVVLG